MIREGHKYGPSSLDFAGFHDQFRILQYYAAGGMVLRITNLSASINQKAYTNITQLQNDILKGTGKRGHIVADTLLFMMFLGRANARDAK